MMRREKRMTFPIGVALIGYGYAGRTFHAPLIAAVPELELRRVISSNPELVHADLPGMSVERDPASALFAPDISLVIVATPNDTHAPLVRLAIEAGKHVVVEKPFALDLTEAKSLAAAAKRHDVSLHVFHNRRWDSDFLTIAAAIRDNVAGTIVHFESHFDRFRPVVRNRWRERSTAGAGVWFDLGPHLVDQALQLFGMPDAVQGALARQRSGAQTDDWAHAILHYGERRVVLHASMLAALSGPRFIAHGTSGSLVKHKADPQERQLQAGMPPNHPDFGHDPDPLVVHSPVSVEKRRAIRGDQSSFYRAIAQTIVADSEQPVTTKEALAVMAVVETVHKAALDGRITCTSRLQE